MLAHVCVIVPLIDDQGSPLQSHIVERTQANSTGQFALEACSSEMRYHSELKNHEKSRNFMKYHEKS